MNLIGFTRRMEAAAADCDVRGARLIATEVRAIGLDYEADLLLMVFGERSQATIDRLLAEVAR